MIGIQKQRFTYNTNLYTETFFNEHIKLYEGYINSINDIEKELCVKDITPINFEGLKMKQIYSLNGAIYHEFFFKNIKMPNNSKPSEKMIQIFKDNYGGIDLWLEDFMKCSKFARGWVIFCKEERTNKYMNIPLTSDDVGLIINIKPIIVLDLYEHVYFGDYGSNKLEYIENFINCICWETVESRIK